MKQLFLSAFFCCTGLCIFSQKVGINKTNPSQVLDINGKLQVGDDAAPATEGTIRYNAATKEYEGYNGTAWVSFTQNKSSDLPTNPKPFYSYGIFSANSSPSSLFMYLDDGSGLYTMVPGTKYAIITMISVESNNLGSTGRMACRVGPATSSTAFSLSSRSLMISGERVNPQIYNSAGSAPLIILRPGEFLSAFNDTNSDYPINIKVRGFIVDDLDF